MPIRDKLSRTLKYSVVWCAYLLTLLGLVALIVLAIFAEFVSAHYSLGVASAMDCEDQIGELESILDCKVS